MGMQAKHKEQQAESKKKMAASKAMQAKHKKQQAEQKKKLAASKARWVKAQEAHKKALAEADKALKEAWSFIGAFKDAMKNGKLPSADGGADTPIEADGNVSTEGGQNSRRRLHRL